MLKKFTLFFIFGQVMRLFAADPVVENVRFEQRNDGSLLVDIYYDVTDNDDDFLDIKIEASDDNGGTWDLPCNSVSGDIGSPVSTGADKHIVWDFFADNPGISGANFRVRILVDDIKTITDIDGNVYKIIKIGEQWWMAENLRVTHYNNGDPITNVTVDTLWGYKKTGAYCYYNNDINYSDDYGALYNWYAVNDVRGLAPAGWHVPTDEDWKQLEIYLGMTPTQANVDGWRGTNEGGKLKEEGNSHWLKPNTGATNVSLFTARPGGCRSDYGIFDKMGYYSYYWTSTESHSWNAWTRALVYNAGTIGRGDDPKNFGWSVRCIKGKNVNNKPPVASFTITPDSGDEETIFTFDASGCSDFEDPISSLQVRWDWEDDGTWDTGFSTTKSITHQYSTEGTKTIRLEVRDTGGLTNIISHQINVATSNTPPVASFTVSPDAGDLQTIFNFDASGCTDLEDSGSSLQVRWDWENDGTWDTGFSATKTATHQYSTEGTKTIRLEVMDTGNLTHSTTRQVLVEGGYETGTVTDVDGNIYRTVKICDQWWMAEDLRVTHYRNGDAIPNVTDNAQWVGLSSGAYCYYNNNTSYATIYGALYNWFAVADSRNIAPTGWHVPTDDEWQALCDCLGGIYEAHEKLKETGTEHWISPNTLATNESGFSGRPGGHRSEHLHSGLFGGMGLTAHYWSATEYSYDRAWYRHLSIDHDYVYRWANFMDIGMSIRCVKGEVSLNTPPTAVFNVSPASGTINTVYSFDASGCNDVEDPVSSLQVRWDWEDDGTWDTEFSTTKTASHEYSTEGTKTIKLEVKDTGNLTHSITHEVLVEGGYETGTVTDIDGNVYRTVKICDQWWMAEDLRVTHYRNGDPLPNVTNSDDWSNLSSGAFCYYDNNSSYAAEYGALYNWYAAVDSRNIAPTGWHVPTDNEWKQLEMCLGMSQEEADGTWWRGVDQGSKLKETGSTHWDCPNTDATNITGFSGRATGFRYANGIFWNFGIDANYWTETEYNETHAWWRGLKCKQAGINPGIYREDDYSKQYGLTIRCVKN